MSAASQSIQGSGNLFQAVDIGAPQLAISGQMDTLALLAALDQTGAGELLQMMRKSSGRDGQLAFEVQAGEFVARGNALENFKACGIAQGLCDFLQLGF